MNDLLDFGSNFGGTLVMIGAAIAMLGLASYANNRRAAKRARRAAEMALAAGGVPETAASAPGRLERRLDDMFTKPLKPDAVIEDFLGQLRAARAKLTAIGEHHAAAKLSEILKVALESPGLAARAVLDASDKGQVFDHALMRAEGDLQLQLTGVFVAARTIAARSR